VANLATFGAIKFGFIDLLLFGLLFKTLMDTLGGFNVYFVIRKLLILPRVGLQTNNKRILCLKLVSILKCVKIG